MDGGLDIMSALDFSSDSEEEAAHAPQPVFPAKAYAAAAPLEASASEAAVSAALVDEPEDLARMTALQHRWTFWFMHRGNHKSGGNADAVFEQALIPVASFQVGGPARALSRHKMMTGARGTSSPLPTLWHGIYANDAPYLVWSITRACDTRSPCRVALYVCACL